MEETGFNNMIAVLAVVVVLVALVNISVTFIKVADLRETMSGYALGYVNLTVNKLILLNMSNDTCDFGAGVVNVSSPTYHGNATVYTNGGAAATVNDGNWSTAARGIVIGNIGNVNLTLTLASSAEADTFVQGSAVNRSFEWNVSEWEAGACPGGGSLTHGTWVDVNTSAQVCTYFNWNPSIGNEILVDFKVVIPADSPDHTAGATITISGVAS